MTRDVWTVGYVEYHDWRHADRHVPAQVDVGLLGDYDEEGRPGRGVRLTMTERAWAAYGLAVGDRVTLELAPVQEPAPPPIPETTDDREKALLRVAHAVQRLGVVDVMAQTFGPSTTTLHPDVRGLTDMTAPLQDSGRPCVWEMRYHGGETTGVLRTRIVLNELALAMEQVRSLGLLEEST
jgi:hypothetical protein